MDPTPRPHAPSKNKIEARNGPRVTILSYTEHTSQKQMASSAILSSISSLENELTRLKAVLNGEPMPVKTKRAKKAKDPNAEKKEPNVWIKFTMRVEEVLARAKAAAGTDEAALAPFKGPATIAKQFASFLKDKKAYDEWVEDDILAEFRTWERPLESKSAKARSAAPSAAHSTAGSGDEGASVTSAEPKQRKKPAPKTDEEKAAINAKRAATKAAKKGMAAAEPAAAEPAAEPVAAAEPAAAEPAAKKTFKKKYTTAQLKESWAPIEGTEYGVNIRGDVADADGNFIGKRSASGAIDKTAAKPADWNEITP